MIPIIKAQKEHAPLLADIGRISFIESHGSSAAAEDINEYVDKTYTPAVFEEELSNPNNIYSVIYYGQQPAGYSKIIFNTPYSTTQPSNVTKLERLYLLKEFYDRKLGHELLQYNIDLSQKNGQEGMWLFVWKENHRAVRFYTKTGFQIIGSYDFKLTETHSNPNHRMLLKY